MTLVKVESPIGLRRYALVLGYQRHERITATQHIQSIASHPLWQIPTSCVSVISVMVPYFCHGSNSISDIIRGFVGLIVAFKASDKIVSNWIFSIVSLLMSRCYIADCQPLWIFCHHITSWQSFHQLESEADRSREFHRQARQHNRIIFNVYQSYK